MIKHTVCFKLKDNSEANCAKTAEVLRSMVGKVPMIRDLEVGIDFLHSPRSYDIILQVTLDSKADLDAYQADPYHVDVVKKHMLAVMESNIALDCDC